MVLSEDEWIYIAPDYHLALHVPDENARIPVPSRFTSRSVTEQTDRQTEWIYIAPDYHLALHVPDENARIPVPSRFTSRSVTGQTDGRTDGRRDRMDFYCSGLPPGVTCPG